MSPLLQTPAAQQWRVRYEARLRAMSEVELADEAATAAALPGEVADEQRRLVDVEREHRRTDQSARTAGARSGLRIAAGAVAAAGSATGAVLGGAACAEYADAVPPQVGVGAVVVAVASVMAVAGVVVARVRRGNGGYLVAVDVPETKLDEAGRALLARVRAERLARGEVA